MKLSTVSTAKTKLSRLVPIFLLTCAIIALLLTACSNAGNSQSTEGSADGSSAMDITSSKNNSGEAHFMSGATITGEGLNYAYEFSYDDEGNVTSSTTDMAGAITTTTYSYNDSSELTESRVAHAGNAETISYGGQMEGPTDGARTYTQDWTIDGSEDGVSGGSNVYTLVDDNSLCTQFVETITYTQGQKETRTYTYDDSGWVIGYDSEGIEANNDHSEYHYALQSDPKIMTTIINLATENWELTLDEDGSLVQASNMNNDVQINFTYGADIASPTDFSRVINQVNIADVIVTATHMSNAL